MLSQLYIQNFAVIKELTIDFSNGFNVFTGETGAGKTMLIHAINAVLGKRVAKDYVRSGEKKATISAVFDDFSQEEAQKCRELGFECEDQLLISRDITSEGKSSCKINGRPATLSLLSQLASNLIIIHGQHDNGIFENAQAETDFIDSYGNYASLLTEYQSLYMIYSEIDKEIKSIHTDTALREQRMDLLKYQIQEIEAANLEMGEEEELRSQRKKIKNAEKIVNLFDCCTELLRDSDCTVIDQLEELTSHLKNIAQYMEEYEPSAQKCQEMIYELQEVSSSILHDRDAFDFVPSDLEQIEDRLEVLRKLKRKYGENEQKIVNFCENAREELSNMETSDDRLIALKEKRKGITSELTVKANNITSERMACSADFTGKVKRELTFLNMPHVELSIQLEQREMGLNGQDVAHFMLSTNPGEPPKPIQKIASGGEISRIMLAIKNVMADKDNIQTLIFDEIDTGVSGVAAQKIGQKLKEVSKSHQVICITHLAQVASFGDAHFGIRKEIAEDQTFTRVEMLTETKREEELAKIIVGENITEASLKSAREMLQGNLS